MYATTTEEKIYILLFFFFVLSLLLRRTTKVFGGTHNTQFVSNLTTLYYLLLLIPLLHAGTHNNNVTRRPRRSVSCVAGRCVPFVKLCYFSTQHPPPLSSSTIGWISRSETEGRHHESYYHTNEHAGDRSIRS